MKKGLSQGKKNKKRDVDYIFFSYIVLLLVFGLIMLTSASSVISYDKFGDHYHFVKRQILYGVLPGFAGLLLLSRFSYPWLKRIGNWSFIGSLFLLLLVLIPGIGQTLNTGARSWIVLAGFSIQPAELAKFGLVCFMAYILSDLGKDGLESNPAFFKILGLGMIPVVLVVLQPDVGTASILFATLFTILFAARAKLSHLLTVAFAAMAAFAGLIILAPYRAARLTTFLHPELDPQGIGYHINQAYLAIGSGGWFGYGLGHSRQKFQYLPEVHADSIFAVISEELGFVLASCLIIFLIVIAIRGLKIAKHAPDSYGYFLVIGFISWLMIQSFFNISSMLGLMPITGVPLPFISHGGTALFIACCAVGVILNVSRQAKEDIR